MNFENLGLAEELLKAVASTGYTTPAPVQQRANPPAGARPPARLLPPLGPPGAGPAARRRQSLSLLR